MLYLPGNGFIRSHIANALHASSTPYSNHFDRTCTTVLDAVGPGQPSVYEKFTQRAAIWSDFEGRLQLAFEAGAHYILISTLDTQFIRSYYTAFKRAQEDLLQAYFHETGLPYTIIRTCCVFGPAMRHRSFIHETARNLLGNEPILINTFEGRPFIRSWTYAPFLASSIVKFILDRSDWLGPDEPPHHRTIVHWNKSVVEIVSALANLLNRVPKNLYVAGPRNQAPIITGQCSPAPFGLEHCLDATIADLNPNTMK